MREKTSLLGLTCTSRNKVMLMMTPPLLRYFWFHSIYSLAASCSLQSAVCGLRSTVCSLRSAVCSLQSAVCSLQMSYTDFSARGATPGPLFCFADGSPVKTSQFTQQLQQALNFCGLDSTKYKSHSFRIGAASLAAEKGLSDAQIRHLGRWKFDAFKLYIR